VASTAGGAFGFASGLIIQEFGYDEDVTDMWISGDSKLVLYSKEYKPVLSRYNLQTQESLPDIRLNGIVQADWIRMGSTNNVCY